MTPYFGIVLLTFIYMLQRYKHDLVAILLIVCFYAGLFTSFGKAIENPYKIFVVLLSVYLVLKYRTLIRIGTREGFLIFSFVLFSISFFISAYLNQTYFVLIFSQYGKYVTPFCVFFIFQSYAHYLPHKIEKINRLLFILLSIQIILSIAKYFMIGVEESIVGSLSFVGGGVATPIPILGFMLLWITKKGKLVWKDWLYVFLLLFIAFVSVKRAIWFMMPIMMALFMIYVSEKKKINKNVLKFLPLLPLVFYFGVRLNPTLNKEQKIWGSFDLDFVLDYAQHYSFGETEQKGNIKKLAEGRGGVTMLLVDKLKHVEQFNVSDMLGYGLQEVSTKDDEHFDMEKFGVHAKGSVTGIFNSYITTGYLGIVTSLLYMFSLCSFVKERRTRYILTGFILWDYCFYSGLIFQTQALAILLFYFVVYSNFQRMK